MFELTTIVKKSTNQVSCVLDEEVAVLNVDQALYFGLQGVGAHIWERLETPRSLAQICDDVVAHFNVSSELCRHDVSSFIHTLWAAGLIEIAD